MTHSSSVLPPPPVSGDALMAEGIRQLQARQLANAIGFFRQAVRAYGASGPRDRLEDAEGYLSFVQMRHEAETAARRSVRLNPRYREDDYGPDDYLLPDATRSFTYAIEVADGCNLRCPSCPRGNLQMARPRQGLMSLALFGRILDKIERDKTVQSPSVWLFNWGEPLLNPDLPAMISAVKARGWYAMLSSNLSLKRDLHDVIAAGPDEFKISLSGFDQKNYAIGHARGRIDLVQDNMRALRCILDATRAETRVWVGFHVYRHNQADVEPMRQLAESLGYYFHAYPASFTPLEKLADLCEGKLESADRAIVDALISDPLARAAENRARVSPRRDCELRFNMMSIGVDGEVDLCCSSFAPENRLGVNFLAFSHEDLQRRKYAHPFCGRCYRLGLQTQRTD